MLRAPVLLVVLLAVLSPPARAAAAPPPIKHVFLIVLENKGYDTTFGAATKAPYLARELPAQGALVRQYFAIGHSSLDNYIAMVSGQGPNPQTQADCPILTEFLPGVVGSDGQALGQGCVYPASVKTIADQLEAKGLTWKGYMEDMGNAAPTEPATCRHSPLGGPDETEEARKGDQYAARHNPYVYFHSIIDRPACAANDVPLDRMPADIASAATTASFSFITPNLCNDGHDGPCVDGRPGKLETADLFLREWVPRILASPGYLDNGMLIVTFDEAGSEADACCGEVQGPNTPNNGGVNQGVGGGRTGAVVISPFVAPGTVTDVPYNHYSMLRSLEDLFGLGHLGYAGVKGLVPFGDDLYTRPAGVVPAAAATGPLRLTVSPRRVVRRRLAHLRLHVTSGGRPVSGARVHVAHAWATTGAAGVARIAYRFRGRPGLRHPSARQGTRVARTTLRVVLRR